MNKKGFTLVEVLAILIIIGLVFAILTPAVSHIIEEAKNKADLRSAEAHVEAAKYYFNRFQTEDDLSIDGNLLEDINVAHKAEEGLINIDNDGNIRMAIVIRNKCYKKAFDSNDITIDNDIEDCTFYTDSKCFAYWNTKNSAITDYLCDGTHEGLEQITDVIIPKKINDEIKITRIAYKVFSNKNISSVVIPNSVNYIESAAFINSGIKKVIIPNSVTKIGASAFANNNLANIVLPDSITKIDNDAFYSNQLTNVVIPNSVTEIENNAFARNRLTNLTLSNSVTKIGDNAFYGNQLTSLSLPNSVTEIGSYAFSYNQLTNVVIPNSVIKLGGFDNNKLTNVTIPNSVTELIQYAFSDNQLTTIELPNNLTKIDRYALAFNNLTEIILPDSLTEIGEQVFAGNPITKITIPKNVTKIDSYALSNIGTLSEVTFKNTSNWYIQNNDNTETPIDVSNPTNNLHYRNYTLVRHD